MKPWIAYSDRNQPLALDYKVALPPVAQPRPRAARMRGRGGVRLYQAKRDHPIHTFRSRIEHASRKAMGERSPFDVPVGVWLGFFFSPPKSMSEAKLKETYGIMGSLPDIDNLIKGVLDAMTTAGVWNTDGRVATISATKMYVSPDMEPYVGIKVYLLGYEKDKPNASLHAASKVR